MPAITPEEARVLNTPMPAAPEVEKEVVGAIFANPALINQAIPVLKTEDFYTSPVADIYGVLVQLSQAGIELTPTFVVNELRKRGKSENVETLVKEIAASGIPTDEIRSHLKVLKEKSMARQLIFVANKAVMRAYKNENPLTIIDETESTLFSLTGSGNTNFVPVVDVADTVINIADKIQGSDKKLSGLETGLTELDLLTCGLQKADLIVVAARPSMGKSGLGMTIAQNAATLDKDAVIAFFSLEMSNEALVQRMLSSTARVDSQKLRNGDLSSEEWSRLIHALGELSKLKIFLDDTSAISPMQLRAKARRLLAEQKRLDLIVVDFIQLMSSSGRKENRQMEMTSIAQELKAIAKELNVPIIALSQLSRAPENRSDHKPQLSDLRESGAIEQAADIVAFIYREEYYNSTPDNKGIVELIVAKQRMGPIDTIRLGFLNQYVKFQNLILA
jgi:replicative DNA helicase